VHLAITLDIGFPQRIVLRTPGVVPKNLNVPVTTISTMYSILYHFEPRDFRADLNLTDRVLKTVPETTIFDRFSDCVAVYDRTLSNSGACEATSSREPVQTTGAFAQSPASNSNRRPNLHLNAYPNRA
jgi:hypothetical protein